MSPSFFCFIPFLHVLAQYHADLKQLRARRWALTVQDVCGSRGSFVVHKVGKWTRQPKSWVMIIRSFDNWIVRSFISNNINNKILILACLQIGVAEIYQLLSWSFHVLEVFRSSFRDEGVLNKWPELRRTTIKKGNTSWKTFCDQFGM